MTLEITPVGRRRCDMQVSNRCTTFITMLLVKENFYNLSHLYSLWFRSLYIILIVAVSCRSGDIWIIVLRAFLLFSLFHITHNLIYKWWLWKLHYVIENALSVAILPLAQSFQIRQFNPAPVRFRFLDHTETLRSACFVK